MFSIVCICVVGSPIQFFPLCLLVFGVDLTTLVKLEGKIIPSILSDCIHEIESREKGK